MDVPFQIPVCLIICQMLTDYGGGTRHFIRRALLLGCKLLPFSITDVMTLTIFFHQIANATVDDADTYKCVATNKYGEAISTTTLKVMEGEIYYWMLLVIASNSDYNYSCFFFLFCFYVFLQLALKNPKQVCHKNGIYFKRPFSLCVNHSQTSLPPITQ